MREWKEVVVKNKCDLLPSPVDERQLTSRSCAFKNTQIERKSKKSNESWSVQANAFKKA